MAVISTGAVAQGVYDAIETLILANKPTFTRTIQGTSTDFTYTLKAEYSRENPDFPQVVLNKANISIILLNLDGSGEDYGIEVQLDFYTKELHGKKAIDEGQDSLRATFIGNLSAFDTDNGLIPQEDFWDDSNSAVFSEGNQIVNTASSLIKFKLK